MKIYSVPSAVYALNARIYKYYPYVVEVVYTGIQTYAHSTKNVRFISPVIAAMTAVSQCLTERMH